MSVKFYMFLWYAVALIAAIFYLSGNLTLLTGVVIGFICFGLTFMGMIAVLPAAVHDETEVNMQVHRATSLPDSRGRIVKALHDLKAAWISNRAEVRRH